MSNKIKVDDKLIDDLSKLAKLKFDKKSSEKIKEDLDRILSFINAISKLATLNPTGMYLLVLCPNHSSRRSEVLSKVGSCGLSIPVIGILLTRIASALTGIDPL